MNIEISNKAHKQLANIQNYISKDNEHYAPIFIEKIYDEMVEIPDFPYKARVAPEFNNEFIRDLIFKNYRIIYEILPDKIRILTVIHGSRDLTDEKNSPFEK
jgi:plasmid stabilization system protein ParE